MQKKILLSPPDIRGNEQKYIQVAFDQNYIAPVGENIDQFESELVTYTKAAHAVALSSGTAGLHLALLAIGVSKGDIVFCSDFTFAASVNPIRYVGAQPVLIDSELQSWNMDPMILEQGIISALEDGKQPSAVIVTHIYGNAANMKAIMAIAKKYRLKVIEDACESLGTTTRDGMTGTIGDIGVYSFNGNKIITTSGGGAIVTNNSEYAEYIKYLSTQAKSNVPYYLHENQGYNYRLSNVLAGIGRGQLESIEHKIARTEEIYHVYSDELRQIDDLQMIPDSPFDIRANRWLSAFTRAGFSPFDLIEHLSSLGIESRALWNPLHKQPYLVQDNVTFVFDTKSTVKANSEQLFQTGICLPSGSNLTENEQAFVIDSVKKFFKQST
jgi:pyridoxal phosphate-dependent aminotransferase EpsN